MGGQTGAPRGVIHVLGMGMAILSSGNASVRIAYRVRIDVRTTDSGLRTAVVFSLRLR